MAKSKRKKREFLTAFSIIFILIFGLGLVSHLLPKAQFVGGEIVNGSGVVGASLSDILLKLSSLYANKDLMKKETFSLEELTTYALDSLDLKKTIDVEESLKNNFICGDFYWLAEAMINILKNAENRPSCDKISISSYKNPLYTSLIIEDNGGGIEKENIKKIVKGW